MFCSVCEAHLRGSTGRVMIALGRKTCAGILKICFAIRNSSPRFCRQATKRPRVYFQPPPPPSPPIAWMGKQLCPQFPALLATNLATIGLTLRFDRYACWLTVAVPPCLCQSGVNNSSGSCWPRLAKIVNRRITEWDLWTLDLVP